MKKVNLLMACLASSIGVASAQTQKVTGQVISAEDGMPVIGAAIIVKGTSIGTVSDLDGKFSLEVPADAKTICRFENQGNAGGIILECKIGIRLTSLG